MARTPPNGRSPSISMSDFNARVRDVLKGNEEVTRGAPKATPGWSRRRNRPLPAASEDQATPETEGAADGEGRAAKAEEV